MACSSLVMSLGEFVAWLTDRWGVFEIGLYSGRYPSAPFRLVEAASPLASYFFWLSLIIDCDRSFHQALDFVS